MARRTVGPLFLAERSGAKIAHGRGEDNVASDLLVERRNHSPLLTLIAHLSQRNGNNLPGVQQFKRLSLPSNSLTTALDARYDRER